MGKLLKSIGLFCFMFGTISWTSVPNKDILSLKCLIQLTNYEGEGAYMAVSLIDPKGKYERTLYVMGEDDKWYLDLIEWYKFFQEKAEHVDGISGATIAGGQRTICMLNVDKSKLDAGYILRFETAVEDHKYYMDDIEIPLTTTNITGKFEGKGYIRYIRIAPNQ